MSSIVRSAVLRDRENVDLRKSSVSENAESLVSAPVCFGPRTDKDDAKLIISNKNHTKHEDMVKSLTLLARHTVLELLSEYDLGASLCQAKRVL
jgi:hypothetical protein